MIVIISVECRETDFPFINIENNRPSIDYDLGPNEPAQEMYVEREHIQGRRFYLDKREYVIGLSKQVENSPIGKILNSIEKLNGDLHISMIMREEVIKERDQLRDKYDKAKRILETMRKMPLLKRIFNFVVEEV